MNPKTYRQLKRLFAEAMDIPAESLPAWLDSNVRDVDMRRELEALLELDTSPSSLDLVHSHEGLTGSAVTEELPRPEFIEGYRVTGVLGQGGSGIVYAVEEDHPPRVLALKVLRPGLFGTLGSQRFERETLILGRLDHPGIARILRAGVTELAWGRVPFLVMEYVEGGNVLDHARAQGCNLKQRLALWLQVCEAVSHAHGKGVIHRDIKPANVLVGAAGQVKVVDFGIGRLLDDDGGDTLTDDGQLVGTLAYMSPEQLAGDSGAVDASTDVYALGILGYELLTGEHPRGAALGSITEIRRAMEAETLTPASRYDSALRGDLETILGKALRKEPAERYGSASALMEDLDRHQRFEPILARPASVGTKLRKFVRRNPWPVAGLTSTALAVLVGFAATVHQARLTRIEAQAAIAARADEAVARQRAERERDTAFAMRDFLRFDLLQAARPSSEPGRGRGVTIDEVLRQASLALGRRGAAGGSLEHFPEVRAGLHSTLGETFTSLGEFEQAQAELLQARQLAEQAGNLSTILQVEAAWVLLENSRSQFDRAEALALSALERAQGPESDQVHARLLGLHSSSVLSQGRAEEALGLFRKAHAVQAKVLGDRHRVTLSTLEGLSNALYSTGAWEQATQILHKVAAEREATLGLSHPETLSSLANIAAMHANTGQYAEASESFEVILAQYLDIYGENHPTVFGAQSRLADFYTRLGNYERAEELLTAVVDGYTRVFGPLDGATLASRGLQAWLYHHRQEYQRAAELYNEIVPLAEEALGRESERVLILRSGRGDTRLGLQQLELGIQDLEFVYRAYQATLRPDNPDIGTLRYKLGRAYQLAGRLEEALPLFRESWQSDVRSFGEHHAYSHMSLLGFALTLVRLERDAEARPLFLQLVEHADPEDKKDRETLRRSLMQLGDIADRAGEPNAAAEYSRRAKELEE